MFFFESVHFLLAIVYLRLEVNFDLILKSVDLFLQALNFALLCPYFFLKFKDYHLVITLCDLTLGYTLL